MTTPDLPDPDLTITSSRNPRLVAALKLRRRRGREQAGQLLVEGVRELRAAVANGHRVSVVFYCPTRFTGSGQGALLRACRAAGAQLVCVAASAFPPLSGREGPGGVVASASAVGVDLAALTLRDPALLVVAEGIEKPGNLGAILRSADAVGADAVIVCGGVTDVNNPNVVRASQGALFAVPVVSAAEMAEVQAFLAHHRVGCLAAAPAAAAPYWTVDMRGPTALVVGGEHAGLTPAWLTWAGATAVRLPMRGAGDSLNVAAAAAVVLYEALRQRAAG